MWLRSPLASLFMTSFSMPLLIMFDKAIIISLQFLFKPEQSFARADHLVSDRCLTLRLSGWKNTFRCNCKRCAEGRDKFIYFLKKQKKKNYFLFYCKLQHISQLNQANEPVNSVVLSLLVIQCKQRTYSKHYHIAGLRNLRRLCSYHTYQTFLKLHQSRLVLCGQYIRFYGVLGVPSRKTWRDTLNIFLKKKSCYVPPSHQFKHCYLFKCCSITRRGLWSCRSGKKMT